MNHKALKKAIASWYLSIGPTPVNDPIISEAMVLILKGENLPSFKDRPYHKKIMYRKLDDNIIYNKLYFKESETKKLAKYYKLFEEEYNKRLILMNS